MAQVSYKDSWDDIQKGFTGCEYGSQRYIWAQSASNIKSTIESTENTKRLVFATRMLAVFTIVLALTTLLYTGIGYMAYKSSQNQTKALKH